MTPDTIRDVLIKSSKIVWGISLLTSPFWVSGATLANIMMNDSGRFRSRFQLGCIFSTLIQPCVLIYTVNRQISRGDESTLTATLPLIPLVSFITCMSLFWKDYKIVEKKDK